MTGFKKRFFKVVAEAYGDPFPVDYEQAIRHEIGDTLADFIYIELGEGVDWDAAPTDQVTQAIGLLTIARDELDQVLSAILEAFDGV